MRLIVLPCDGIRPEIVTASMILSVAMMPQWLGGRHETDTLARAAMAMEEAVDKVLKDPASCTRDLGGTMGCQASAERVAATVAAMG